MDKYLCKLCGYIDDTAKIYTDSNVNPGTIFYNVYDSKGCPLLRVSKNEFEMSE